MGRGGRDGRCHSARDPLAALQPISRIAPSCGLASGLLKRPDLFVQPGQEEVGEILWCFTGAVDAAWIAVAPEAIIVFVGHDGTPSYKRARAA